VKTARYQVCWLQAAEAERKLKRLEDKADKLEGDYLALSLR